MNIYLENIDAQYEVYNIVSSFIKFDKIKFTHDKASADLCLKFDNKIFAWYKGIFASESVGIDFKNSLKRAIYNVLSKSRGTELKWGIITGVRPSLVFNKCGKDINVLKNDFFVDENKIKILKDIDNFQIPFQKNYNNKDICLYVSIPFCPSKCSYCSFVSNAIDKKLDIVKIYFELLLNEIKLKADIVKNFGLNIKSIYVGGGTPGILSYEQINQLFNVINNNYDIKDAEICFEIGRPETVTKEKLLALKNNNVKRLCINTQTTNDDILKSVYRKHTSKDFFDAIALAKGIGFDSINVDVIAGLPNESFESFKKTVEDVIKTGVDNITIHTLSIKRSSILNESIGYFESENAKKMIEYSQKTLYENGFLPYYIYRQKNTVSEGENIGYCKDLKICAYNIYMMEDFSHILSFGAGSTSKIVYNNIVERIYNYKYPTEYISNFEKAANNAKIFAKKLGEINAKSK